MEAFGWNTLEIGHDMAAVRDALNSQRIKPKPTAIIANTVRVKVFPSWKTTMRGTVV